MGMVPISAVARALARGTFLAAALAASGAASAADGVALLRQWLHATHSAQAAFTQTVRDDKHPGAGSVSAGDFAFERPGRFRWSYTRPYQQDIVSDGRTIWTYDHDLNQVTITTQARALNGTPAALLSGADVESVFTLSALPDADGLQWVQAVPRSADSSFVWVRLGLRAGTPGPQLVQMQLRDAFQRTSVIEFSKQRDNVHFATGTFHFVAPAGAAVTRQP